MEPTIIHWAITGTFIAMNTEEISIIGAKDVRALANISILSMWVSEELIIVYVIMKTHSVAKSEI